MPFRSPKFLSNSLSAGFWLVLATIPVFPLAAQDGGDENQESETEANANGNDASATSTSEAATGRVGENAIVDAEDAFGVTVGREAIGLYGSNSVRGFSPTVAGNVRIEGMFFDQQGGLTGRIQSGSTIRVGVAAQADPFPAPTGIVDISLRQSKSQSGLSALGFIGPYESYGIEGDVKMPIGQFGSVSAGAGVYYNRFSNGGSGRATAFGIVPRADFGDGNNIVAFWGRSNTFDETAPPIYIPRDAGLPPEIERGTYDGPQWVLRNGFIDNAGLVAKAKLNEWQLSGGVFLSSNNVDTSFANIVSDIAPDLTAQRIVFANPSSQFQSTSGEVRVSRGISDGPRQHLLLVSARARYVRSRFGGSDFIDLGRAALGESISPAKPTLEFAEQTLDKVHQETLGLSYGLNWKDYFQIRAGLQITRYEKSIEAPLSEPVVVASTSYLPNLTGTMNVASGLLAYFSYAQGLEQNGQAPDFAANRLALLPALITTQYDVGLKWDVNPSTKVIVGYFSIKKPYLNLDQQNLFRQLGEEVHSGLEISVASTISDNLRLVGGAIIQQPLVKATGAANEVGELPVGQSKIIAQINADYKLPLFLGLSFDGSLSYTGRQAGDVLNRTFTNSFVTFGLGARYAFKAGNVPASLRISATNITNEYRWLPIGSGAYEPLNQRSIRAYVTVDF